MSGNGQEPESTVPELSPDARQDGMMGRLKGLWTKGGTTEDSVSQVLQEGDASTPPNRARREMIERVMAFDSKRVADVMIPRADIVAVERSLSLTELLKCFSDAGHSRLPVYRGDLDNPVGMVHIRDLVGILADPEQGEQQGTGSILSKLVRDVLYVPASMSITDLLLRMQADRIHMALVIDEFGGTDGLVTIEDLVEEIVGDIQDEHDDDEDTAAIKQLSMHSWEANARLFLEELHEQTGVKLETDEDDVDTVGGLVFTLAGRVPLRGEMIQHPAGVEFEVLEADPRRIRKVKIRLLQAFETPDAAGGAAEVQEG